MGEETPGFPRRSCPPWSELCDVAVTRVRADSTLLLALSLALPQPWKFRQVALVSLRHCSHKATSAGPRAQIWCQDCWTLPEAASQPRHAGSASECTRPQNLQPSSYTARMSEGPEIHRSHSHQDTQILALCPKLHGLWDWLGFQPCFHMWASCWRWCTGPELACHAPGSAARMRPRWALALRLCARGSSGALVVDVGSFPRTPWVHTLLQPVQPVSTQPTPVLSPSLSSEACV